VDWPSSEKVIGLDASNGEVSLRTTYTVLVEVGALSGADMMYAGEGSGS